MSCANCALGVEKALNNQLGVTKANVNFANNIVLLDFSSVSVVLNSLRLGR